MSEKKLNPRVGDRVTIVINGRTYVGDVVDPLGSIAVVAVDGRGTGVYPIADLAVVDREPVKWPEGWFPADGWKTLPQPIVRFAGVYAVLISKADLENIIATGPDMLARWDELVGGDE